MKVKKFIFIEALICDARWYDVTRNKTDEQRLSILDEMWIRWNSYIDSNVQNKVSMTEFINETIYANC